MVSRGSAAIPVWATCWAWSFGCGGVLMSRKSPSKPLPDSAHLVAHDAGGRIVLELRMSLGEYYQELHSLIDCEEFRSERGIVRVTGRLYDSGGALIQEFECHYSDTGRLV